MFENCGEKIKNLARILFVISIIASVILAISYGWTAEYSSFSGRYKKFHAVTFFVVLIGGVGVSYVEALLVYAFGELVENSTNIWSKMKNIDISNSASCLGSTSSQANINMPSASSTTSSRVSTSSQGTRHFKICPSCGEENPSDKFFCNHCGSKL